MINRKNKLESVAYQRNAVNLGGGGTVGSEIVKFDLG